ncbi:polyprenyl synthetase family protein [Amycolatopsis sp. cg5]|uniref:polyprenyl synthetase family protein n=1 Tax=Amycolatopsis sp. cg5 TaxID=3238802 RepID=UPI00352595F1
MPAPLSLGAGFHFGWWDALRNPISVPSGKMVRPAFALQSAQAVNDSAADSAMHVAVAVELVHNFSLVHDDVIDADERRHGRPTVWAQFGVPYAIILGDALLALASQALVRGGEPGTAAMCDELNQAVLDLCLGQHLDISFEELAAVSADEYLEMAGGKTSSLLAAACVLGGLAGDATSAQLTALRSFGHHVGLAFQLVDDLLGIWGDPVLTGKPVGGDLRRYKKSMPVIAALSSGTPEGVELAHLYQTRSIVDQRQVARAAALADRAGAREWTEAQAAKHHRFAIESLHGMDGNPAAIARLDALADLVIRRDS